MADGSAHSLIAIRETTYGTTPANPPINDLKGIRITGTTLGLSKDSLSSEEIRPNRQISDFRLGSNQVGGDINFELSSGTLDDLLQTALLSTSWDGGGSSAGSISQTATAGKFQYRRTAGSFDPLQVGDIIRSDGGAYAGLSLVTGVTALALTVQPLQGAFAQAAAKQMTLNQVDTIRCGQERSSFTFVRHFSDVANADKPFYLYRGVEINTMNLTVGANAIITGSFSVVGMSQEVTDADGNNIRGTTIPLVNGAVAAEWTTSAPLDSFTGNLHEGGEALGVLTEITLTLENGLEPRFVIGEKNSIRSSVGRSNLTGQVTGYFENSALVKKFLDETPSSLVFTLPDGAGDDMTFYVPHLKYTGGQPDVSGEGPITLTMPFQALYDETADTNLVIIRESA